MLKLDPRALLTIDVAAEVRKLAEALGEDGSRLPIELVRLLVRSGAREIAVSLLRSQLRLRADGAGFDPSLLSDLAALRDPRASGARRHRALLRLEAEAPALLGLAGLAACDVLVETAGCRFRHAGSRPPEITTAAREAGTRITVEGFRNERERARLALEEACRFAPARIRLEGREIPRGFEDVLAHIALPAPLSGALALPARGETARVLLLQGGVVAARLTIPEAPCFEAAVELAGGRSPSQLREAAVPLVPALIAAAVELLHEAGEHIRDFADEDQRRIRRQLLAAARRHGNASSALKLPLVAGYVAGETRWFSLLDLRPSSGGAVLALHPGQDPRGMVAGPDPVVVLDAQERRLLGELLGLRFAPPAPRPPSRRWEGWRRVLRALLLLLDRRPGRPIPEERLSSGERAFLAALGEAGASACLAEGVGPVRRRAGRWAIPRGNPLAAACRRVVTRDPAWGYTAALALLGERGALAQRGRR